MKNKLISIALIIFTAISVYAQDAFKVLASKGLNIITADGTIITTGKRLKETDIIKVDGYLGLMHNSGKTIEIKVAGRYKVSDLSKKASAVSNIGKKYSDYIVAEMSKTENDIHANYQKNMKVTGSVDRAVGNVSDITILLPKNSLIIDNVNTISWLNNKKVTTYTLEIRNMFDDILLTKETTDTTITFDVNSLKLPKDNSLLVKVICSSLTSNISILKVANISKNADLIAENSYLKTEYADESALNYLMKASFYAQNNLFIDAKKSFEAAIRLEPEVEEYKNAYLSFLAKNNLLY